MATTKSTVVGIRLDHERRAWVEAEAARLGVSVRGLFEGMIDEARSGEQAEADRAIAGLGSAGPSQVAGQSAEESPRAQSPDRPAVRAIRARYTRRLPLPGPESGLSRLSRGA